MTDLFREADSGTKCASPDGGGFIRFGIIPSCGKSVNYLKMSFSQNEDFTYYLEDGLSPEEALSLAVGIENVNQYLESGVSVFEKDKDGLPKIDNLQQASSLALRIGKPIYEIRGTVVGVGRDGEPLVNVKEQKELSISDEKLVLKIESVLKKNYSTVKNDEIRSEKPNVYRYTYHYYDGFSQEERKYPNGTRVVLFNGKEYTNPISGWNDKLG